MLVNMKQVVLMGGFADDDASAAEEAEAAALSVLAVSTEAMACLANSAAIMASSSSLPINGVGAGSEGFKTCAAPAGI